MCNKKLKFNLLKKIVFFFKKLRQNEKITIFLAKQTSIIEIAILLRLSPLYLARVFPTS